MTSLLYNGSVLSTLSTLVADADTSWQYAAWVAVDLKLLLFVLLIAALAAAGIATIFVRGRQLLDYAAVFAITFILLSILGVVIFNAIAHHPVFVVEALFPFP